MTILYFGTYDPSYARNRVLMQGLRVHGVKVVECRVPPRRGALAMLAWKYLTMQPQFDAMVVGFPGQSVMFLARLLTRKPIVFDAFTSHYGGYILDRRVAGVHSMRAYWYRFLDRWSCRLARVVLLDTDAHIDFFVREFGIAREKFRRIFVGTDVDIFYPRSSPTHDFTVHFHGSGIPLQGIPYIRRAMEILSRESITFQIIDGSKRVPYERLPELMARADVCLGIFGDSPKTSLVIPNKVYEAVAMGKPVITADTPAIRELFDEHSLYLIPPGDPEALARAIVRLRDDPALRRTLAERARAILIERATPIVLGLALQEIIQSL